MISLLMTLALWNSAHAQEGSCTDWKKVNGVSCVFAGEDSFAWKRDCSNAPEELQCRRSPGNKPAKTPCLAERICYDTDPGQLESDCSEWIKEDGVRCGTQGKPTVWRRACTMHGIPTTACTEYRKPYPTEEDYDH